MKLQTILIAFGIITILCVGSFFAINTIFGQEINESEIITELEETFQKTFHQTQKNSENDARKYNQALYYVNDVACETMSDDKKRHECIDYVIITKVLQNQDDADCDHITHEGRRRECIDIISEKTASESGNKFICQHISDNNIQERCKNAVDAKKLAEFDKKKNATEWECKKLDGNFQKECLKLLKYHNTEKSYISALHSKNIAECTSITDEHLRKKCHDEIFITQAENYRTPELCTSIQNHELKSDCIRKSLNAYNNQKFQDAMKSENLALCQAIHDHTIRDRCHDIIILSLTRKTKNTALCSGLKNHSNKALCQEISNF